MIAVRLWGRLGNQLFQYSFGRALSLQRNEGLYFFNPEYISGLAVSPLSNFDIEIKYLDASQIKNFYRFSWNSCFFRTERKLLALFPRINRNVFIENSQNVIKLRSAGDTFYDGYWHSYKYFSEISDLLRNEIRPKDVVNIPAGLSDDITRQESVSVHFRRGDYLAGRNRGIYMEVGEKYYRDAISFLIKRSEDPVFYIFSDDIEWVRENMVFLSEYNSVFVEHNHLPGDCIDLTLMRMCKHHIIANSTFSWWGAFLGRMDNIVIAPERWYLNDRKLTIGDLIPPEWITM